MPLAASRAVAQSPGIGATLFHPQEQSQIRESWSKIMRWSREFKARLGAASGAHPKSCTALAAA